MAFYTYLFVKVPTNWITNIFYQLREIKKKIKTNTNANWLILIRSGLLHFYRGGLWIHSPIRYTTIFTFAFGLINPMFLTFPPSMSVIEKGKIFHKFIFRCSKLWRNVTLWTSRFVLQRSPQQRKQPFVTRYFFPYL